MKAYDLLPALIRRVAQEESTGGAPSGLAERIRHRLEDILHHSTGYYFGPADRLIPWVAPQNPPSDPALRSTAVTSVLTPIWDANREARQAKLSSILTDLIKANKRVLLVAPDNRTLDETLVASAKALRGAGLQYRSFLCRYEPPSMAGANGINLRDLSFDEQVSAFLGRSQSDKAGLRRKLTRYLELAPILHYKAEKQKDLDEVRHLEWRLLSALGDVQASIKRLEDTLSVYETLPIWHRLGMQVVGSNVDTMKENCILYEAQKQEYLRELEIAQARIDELKPEAYVEPEMRPEYEELKDEVYRLGGVERVREVLATEEDTTRRPFLQAKRVIAATAVRVAGDTIFTPLRYDALLVVDAPRIPLPLLFVCACMTRERIVLAGDPQELPEPKPTQEGWLLGWHTSLAADSLFPAGTPLR
ncbi:MAG TPA: hypothetical protein VGJ57_10780 [Nitrospirales bacterium]